MIDLEAPEANYKQQYLKKTTVPPSESRLNRGFAHDGPIETSFGLSLLVYSNCSLHWYEQHIAFVND